MSIFRLIIMVGFIFLSSVNVWAGSGAFRVETPDAGAFGKGSAFVGEANTPAAVYYNPAGINQIKSFQISSGGAFIAPQVNYKDTSGQITQMRRNVFLVPHVYAVLPVNQKLSLGFGSTSNWGTATEWAADSFSKYVATKSEITNINTYLSASYQVTDQWSLAISADNDDSKASKEKLFYNFGFGTDGNLQIKAKDNAWGYRLATMFKINDQNQVGLMYRSAVNHTYKGKIYIDGINTAVYGGSGFSSSSYETNVTEKLTLPQSIILGYSLKPNTKWTFNFDLEWMNWSTIKKETLNFPDETNSGRLGVLNTGNPIDRHWHSSFSEAIGAEYAATDRLRLRAGYYHHDRVIPEGTFDTSLPDSSSHGLTTGFGFDFNKRFTLDMTYSGLFYQNRKVNQSSSTTPPYDISGKYKQFINMGTVTVTYKY